MSIPNRQIGWNQETYLWWEVLNELSKIKKSLGSPPGLILCMTADRKLFKLDVKTGKAKQLPIDIASYAPPGFQNPPLIIHSETKLYINNISNNVSVGYFLEYDITLSPWSATYSGIGSLPFSATNSGLLAGTMQQGETSKGWYAGFSGIKKLYNIDLTNLSSISFTNNFPLVTNINDNITDVLETTDGKILATGKNDGNNEAVIKQFDLAGNLELTINTGLFNFYFFGLVEQDDEIYLIGSALAGGPNKLYKIDSNPPYAITFIGDIDTGGSRIFSVSQVPKYCTKSFEL